MKYGEGSGSVRVGDGTCTMVSNADSTWLAPGKPAAYADTPFVGQGRNSPFSIIERSFGAWILSLSPKDRVGLKKPLGSSKESLHTESFRQIVVKHLTPLRTAGK